MKITEAELFDALAAVTAAPDDARTVRELADATGVSTTRTKAALQRLAAAGRLQVHRVTRVRIDGQSQLVPAYTIRGAP